MASESWKRGHLGCDLHNHERSERDFYCTPIIATEELCSLENFSEDVWEPACGSGAISSILEQRGYKVRKSDIMPSVEGGETLDFMQCSEKWDGDIITNPPYKIGVDFVRHALDLVGNGHKVAMFLSITFLETKKRCEFLEAFPPSRVYIARRRLHCTMPGELDKGIAGIVCYCWVIWEKGYRGEPILRWFH